MSNEHQAKTAAEKALDALTDSELNDLDDDDVQGFAAYIKFDGVDGESKDSRHQGWSDIQSFGQAIHKPVVQINEVQDPFRG